MKRIEHLLRETIGLDAASIGSTSIQRAVRLRMRSLGLRSAEDYGSFWKRRARNGTNWSSPCRHRNLVLPRASEPFAALVRLVREEWLPAHPAGPVRLLSIPCASGEEPYSLVMALLDAGVPPERFQIEPSISALARWPRPARGVYGRNSFRGKDLAFREPLFQPVKEGYLLAPAVRNASAFPRPTCSALTSWPAGQYDFIFCRNLLIYFDRLTQQRRWTDPALACPSGVLFVGPAEQPLVLDHGFVTANLPLAFACRKAAGEPVPSRSPPRPSFQAVGSRAVAKGASRVRNTGRAQGNPLTPALSQQREKHGAAHSERRQPASRHRLR